MDENEKDFSEEKASTEPEIKYCPNCGSEIENGNDICQSCKELKSTQTHSLMWIKDFVIKWGRFIVDIDTCILFFGICLITLILGITFLISYFPNDVGYFELVKLAPLLFVFMVVVPIILTLVVVFYKFFVYLAISMCDSLKTIEVNTRKKAGK